MKKNLTRIVLTVFLIILSLYFLYPTYQDYNLNKELKGKTGQDSIDFVDKNGEKLKSARDKRIKLGLDLKGGMYVVLDVDIVKLLEDLSKKKVEEIKAPTHLRPQAQGPLHYFLLGESVRFRSADASAATISSSPFLPRMI